MMRRLFGSRIVRTLACVLALGSVSTDAGAVIVDSAGDSFEVFFGGNVEGGDVPGLTAYAYVEVDSISGNTMVLDITLTNTTSVLFETARVSAFGFDTNPDVASATLVSSVFSNVNLGGSFPNGFGSVDLCVINNRNNCNGGASGGLDIGESTTLTLTLYFNSAIPSSGVDLDNFGVRYQSLNSEALGLEDESGTGRPINPIPEPSSVALFLLGGVLVAGAVRKQVLTAG